jgi:hypothetical protein
MTANTQSTNDQAVAEGGAYEVLRKRLIEQGGRLRAIAEQLNAQRLAEFGSSQMAAIGRLRVRTENNCVPRDLVQVGDCLLFGYNVFLGLKKETQVEDVFSLYRLVEGAEGYDVEQLPLAGSFLAADSFAQDFRELYAYYKNTRLLQLVRRDELLLAAFQIGERISDVRVFRWNVAPDGQIRYVDNRGERDIALPPAYDFEWTRANREHIVEGRFPHLNILDQVFVETIGGDLTVKIENNTEDGLGIYREPVNDQTQSLDDANVDFARVGSLVLLRIQPYREEQWRYLAFNTLTRSVLRIDAIGQACVQLPEDHGIVFPGGYLLQNGEYKTFERPMTGMRFKRSLRSPNGEDVLYVFYEPEEGRSALFTYNLIERRLQTPIFGHGHARLEDGRMVIFSAESSEPTRVHPMQVWQTPFYSDLHAASQPTGTSFMGRIGNAELVRGVSDLLSLSREIDAEQVSMQRYEQLAHSARRLFDLHHWLADANVPTIAPLLREIAASGEAVLDEFEKVEGIRRQSSRALAEAQTRQRELLTQSHPDRFERVEDYVAALNALTTQRGHLLTIRDYRYIDTAAIDALEVEVQNAHAMVSQATGAYLAGERALQPLNEQLKALDARAQAAAGVSQLAEPLAQMAAMAANLDMLSTLMAGLQIDDAAQRTRIVEAISELYARLNQARARGEQRRKSLGSHEAVAQFGAQFTLFGQSLTAALGLATDPERCDEQLSRILVQLETLESQFGEHEQFLGDIQTKREEVLEAFEAHKQALLDERQRKAQAVQDAAQRILDGFARRTARLASSDELNAFFAGDPLILKLRELITRLRALNDSVKADAIEARLKGARDQAVRALRDKTELFEGDGNVIRLGPRHRFSVNTQELDLTLMARGDTLCLHLTGTDYLEPLQRPELEALRDWWVVSLESESAQLYRGEYLAAALLEAALAGRDGLSIDLLRRQLDEPDALNRTLREFAAPRYREGYEKGIHDHDAALILRHWLPLRDSAGTLAHAPQSRAWAVLAWSQLQAGMEPALWPQRARQARQMRELLGSAVGQAALTREISDQLLAFGKSNALLELAPQAAAAAAYLVDELAAEHPQFVFSKYARQLATRLRKQLDGGHRWAELQATLEQLGGRLAARWALLTQWLQALLGESGGVDDGGVALAAYLPEAAALLLVDQGVPSRVSEVDLQVRIEGLLGQHARITAGAMTLGVDEFGQRLEHHRQVFLPGLQRFQALRHEIVSEARHALRLEEFKPRPLSSFVRNKLINDIYLAIIGDNLAKQMGTVGESKRSDLMGLLMLISPPGYGKTTLMEYVAHRLGLIFMKINGPALGHEVRSLDPAQAPDATSRQELEKLNLALEMGNNVMLYVDDIQHTHPEFLQKFISLCDGTRRIEGVWRGRTRTYDMRGKKFCVVMAGNPYTESGEVFRIPDMLANRADVYNLGDVLGGMQDAFLLSYIENAMTSNPVLAPLATREMKDLYLLVDKAQGREFSANSLSHSYSAAEISEIVAVLQRMMEARNVVFRVNQQYIASAAQADAYRTEPPFRLQGSYRNMNKLAEKITAVMNPAELAQLLHDHYIGESQLLTTGAEENLLKLGELRGSHTPEQAERWAQIKRDFSRNKSIGGADADTGTRVVAQLRDLVEGVQSLRDAAADAAAQSAVAPDDADQQAPHWDALLDLLQRIASEQALARTFSRDTAADSAMWLGGLRNALDLGFRPLVQGMEKRAEQNDALQVILREIARRMAPPGK